MSIDKVESKSGQYEKNVSEKKKILFRKKEPLLRLEGVKILNT